MLQFFYTVLSYLIQPLVLLIMWQRGMKQPDYRKRLAERYACYNGLSAPEPQPSRS